MSGFKSGVGINLPKSLIKAAQGVLDTNNLHEVGDQVLIADGPNSGRTGTVVGSKTSGYSDVQIDHGRQITIKNDSVQTLNEKRNRLDKVSKKELKGKFKDREDQDIDNDGDEDESDEYLHNRRQVVDKKISKRKGKKNGNGKNGEEVEIDPDLDETLDMHRQANLLKASHAVAFL